jgi:hypothetical protein
MITFKSITKGIIRSESNSMINSRRRDGGWSPVTIGIATVILLATILLLYTVSSFRSSSSSSSLSSSLRQAEKDDWSDPDRPTERPFRTRPRRQDTPDVPSSAQVNYMDTMMMMAVSCRTPRVCMTGMVSQRGGQFYKICDRRLMV